MADNKKNFKYLKQNMVREKGRRQIKDYSKTKANKFFLVPTSK